jgi:hypothetical protein
MRSLSLSLSLSLSPLCPLLTHHEVSCFAPTRPSRHDVLDYHRPTVMGPSDHDLKSPKPWAKTNLFLFTLFLLCILSQ